MKNCLITGTPLFIRGKVKNIYDLGDRLLIVASDRISSFDVVLPTNDIRQGNNPDRPFSVLVPRDGRHSREPPAYH